MQHLDGGVGKREGTVVAMTVSVTRADVPAGSAGVTRHQAGNQSASSGLRTIAHPTSCTDEDTPPIDLLV